jgi:signal transduction histidine kinase
MNSGFLDKLIERISRVQPQEVESYLLRLADEKGFLETIFNAIHEGVIVTDLKGRVSYLNRAACEFFSLAREQAMGKPLKECIKGLEWETMFATGTLISRDMEVFYPQHRYLNFYIEPLQLEEPQSTRKGTESFNKEAVGFAVILRDITENRKSTEETIHSERLSALTLLAAGVAHEIGNPLNSLHIHLQLLERKLRKVPESSRHELQNALEVAKGEIQRLDTIVQQFLGAIRPAHLELSLENINVLVRESVSFLAPEIEDRDITVREDLRADLPLAEVDRTQIKQAFFNVIKNAFQAMRSGGVLKIETTLHDNFIRITFSDTGGGISPADMSKIFEPYFTTKAGGSGLGLLIVRRIVREHGGEIDLVSHDGEGLELNIRLPLRDQRVRLLPPPSEPASHLKADGNGGEESWLDKSQDLPHHQGF